jgi:hypothetical protein
MVFHPFGFEQLYLKTHRRVHSAAMVTAASCNNFNEFLGDS